MKLIVLLALFMYVPNYLHAAAASASAGTEADDRTSQIKRRIAEAKIELKRLNNAIESMKIPTYVEPSIFHPHFRGSISGVNVEIMRDKIKIGKKTYNIDTRNKVITAAIEDKECIPFGIDVLPFLEFKIFQINQFAIREPAHTKILKVGHTQFYLYPGYFIVEGEIYSTLSNHVIAKSKPKSDSFKR